MVVEPRPAVPASPVRHLPPTWVQVRGRAVDVQHQALVVAAEGVAAGSADLVEQELDGLVPVAAAHLGPEELDALPPVVVRLPGPDAASDVGAAAALVRAGVRMLVTDHPVHVRRAVVALAAVLEARR